MSARIPQLALRPELCNRCGRCVRACPLGKLKIASGYIYIDTVACTGCLSCANVCEPGAIQPWSQASHDARPVVRSRAEAKALRAQEGRAKAPRVKALGTKKPTVKKATDDKAPAKAVQAQKVFAPEPAVAQTGGWTLVDAAAVFALLLLTAVVKDFVLGSKLVTVMPPAGRAVTRVIVLCAYYSAQLAFLVYLARRHGGDLLSAFRLRVTQFEWRSAASTAGAVALLLVGTRAVSTGWGALAQGVGWSPGSSETLSAAFGGGATGLLLASLMVVFVGPVVEEIAFRGVLFGALRSRLGFVASMLISSAVFSAYHWSVWVAVPTFVLGIATAWLAERARSLWPAVTLHVLYNGVAVAGVFWLAAR